MGFTQETMLAHQVFPGVPPREKRQVKINLVSLTIRDSAFRDIHLFSYVSFSFSFSFYFKDLDYLNRATMRAKEFSPPLATARGPYASSLCLQTN